MLGQSITFQETHSPVLKRQKRRSKQDVEEASGSPGQEEFRGTEQIPLLPVPSTDWEGRPMGSEGCES